MQAIGFIGGILIIRYLPVEEYALYILANTMLGTMTVLADGGISQGVMAEGGKVWQDPKKLGIVLATGLDLRRKFAIGSLAFASPILFYLLWDNGASWLIATMIVLSLIPAFYASLSDTLLQIVPKLHQNIRPLQRNQVEVGIGRLLLIFFFVLLFPFSFVAVLSNGLPRVYGNFRLHKIAAKNVILDQKPDAEVRRNILKIVKRILPGAIYYAISGQLIIWLISFFGSTKNIAEVGALNRLATVTTLILLLIDFLFVPRFAKLKNDRKNILKEYFTIQLFLLILSIIFVFGVYLFDDLILFILGDAYRSLNIELFLMAVSSCIVLFSTSTNKLLSSRGIVVPPLFFIPIVILFQIFSAFLVELGSVRGIIFYSILTTLPIILIRVIYLFKNLRNS